MDAWQRGFTAGLDRWPDRDNPFPGDTELAQCWLNGWHEGKRRRQPDVGQNRWPHPGEASGSGQ